MCCNERAVTAGRRTGRLRWISIKSLWVTEHLCWWVDYWFKVVTRSWVNVAYTYHHKWWHTDIFKCISHTHDHFQWQECGTEKQLDVDLEPLLGNILSSTSPETFVSYSKNFIYSSVFYLVSLGKLWNKFFSHSHGCIIK